MVSVNVTFDQIEILDSMIELFQALTFLLKLYSGVYSYSDHLCFVSGIFFKYFVNWIHL